MNILKIVNILFGKGWYIVLYLATYFWYFFIPGMMVSGYIKESWRFARNGGVNSSVAGLGSIVPLIFTPVVMAPVLLVSSILWVITLNYGLLVKILIVVGISIIIPVVLGILGMYMLNEVYYAVYYGGYFGLFAFHLFMLYKFVWR
jgi:hypothetical protein